MINVKLRPGLELSIEHYQLHDRLNIPKCDRPHPLVMCFQISGQNCDLDGFMGAEKTTLCGSGLAVSEEWQQLPQHPVISVSMHIEPELVIDFWGEDDRDIDVNWNKLFETEEQPYFVDSASITPQMQMALQQILNCPYQGAIARMYLESKVWELMALQLAQMKDDNRPSHRLLRHGVYPKGLASCSIALSEGVSFRTTGVPPATAFRASRRKTTEPSYKVCTGGINASADHLRLPQMFISHAWETTGDRPVMGTVEVEWEDSRSKAVASPLGLNGSQTRTASASPTVTATQLCAAVTVGQYSLKSEDRDRLYLAQQILGDRLDHPPSLTDLAQEIGLNECTLKRGFRQLFGTTVFGYLYQQRMEYARQLLQQRELNVGQVAKKVGYASQSRFATAFRKKFGINPKVFARRSPGNLTSY